MVYIKTQGGKLHIVFTTDLLAPWEDALAGKRFVRE